MRRGGREDRRGEKTPHPAAIAATLSLRSTAGRGWDQFWPTQSGLAVSRQRARMASYWGLGRGPALRRVAFSSHRSGLMVPTIMVWTPGVEAVKRRAISAALG